MTETPAVWFVADHENGRVNRTALGLAAEARRLAASVGGQTCAFLAGRDVDHLAAAIPADTVLLASHPDLEEAPDLLVAVLERAVREWQPRILLLAAAPREGQLAARLAARLGVATVPHALRVDPDARGGVQVLRNVYGGRASCLIQMGGANPMSSPCCLSRCRRPRPQGRPRCCPLVCRRRPRSAAKSWSTCSGCAPPAWLWSRPPS